MALIMTPHGHVYPLDPDNVMSNVEVWNFCKRYSLEDFYTSNIPGLVQEDLCVIAQEYYTLMGQKLSDLNTKQLKGVYIIKNIMSDGSTTSEKVYFE